MGAVDLGPRRSIQAEIEACLERAFQEQGPNPATVLHVLGEVPRLLVPGPASVSML